LRKSCWTALTLNSRIEQVTPLLGHQQHTPLLEAPKPALSIPHYKTQLNTIKQLLRASGKIAMCWGALLRGVGSLTQCVKPLVTFGFIAFWIALKTHLGLFMPDQ